MYTPVTFSQAIQQSDFKGVSQETAAKHIGLLQADLEFAYANGGSFIQNFLSEWYNYELDIPEGYEAIVDSKVHMLKKDWWPCIPGWHVDFAPNWEGIVDWDKVDPNERHFMAISSNVSRTVYLDSPLMLSVPHAPKINGFLSQVIDAYVKSNGVQVFETQKNMIYEFDQLTPHMGNAAWTSGWRIFVRLSITKLRPVLNHIRTQPSQVYISDINAGW